jgi:predicted DNA-binding antitoxin AbrB/MazE fold protein
VLVAAPRSGYTSVMTDSIRAIYENGVFRPLDTPNLPEHQQVRLTVESIEPSTKGKIETDKADPLADVRVSTGISDLAEHFDDYRFGRRHP